MTRWLDDVGGAGWSISFFFGGATRLLIRFIFLIGHNLNFSVFFFISYFFFLLFSIFILLSDVKSLSLPFESIEIIGGSSRLSISIYCINSWLRLKLQCSLVVVEHLFNQTDRWKQMILSSTTFEWGLRLPFWKDQSLDWSTNLSCLFSFTDNFLFFPSFSIFFSFSFSFYFSIFFFFFFVSRLSSFF